MEQYSGGLDISQMIFTWHWSMIGWGIALVVMIIFLTRYWKYIWRLAFIINGIGWLCTMYAGLTGEWFIGWFVWVIPLSVIMFMRFVMEYAMNLSYEGEK